MSKSSDADMENSETLVWLDFALACHYINEENRNRLGDLASEVGKMLNHMIEFPEKYRRKSPKNG